MSTAFRPLEIPPGVVAKPTKKMSSSNWSEVNCVRWVEERLTPIGGQAAYNYTFASKCKAVHGWYGIDGIYRTAYLCENNLYVDTGGVLTDITPTGGMIPPPSATQGGYGDGYYSQGDQIHANGSFTTSSTTITMLSNTGWNMVGVDVHNVTTNQHVGKVASFVGTTLTLTAAAASASQTSSDLLNFGAYNEPRPIIIAQAIDKVPPAFSLDNFGSNLYAMVSYDGRLLKWDPAVGGLATVQAADSGRGPVPNGRCFVVTPERFVVIFGSQNDGTAAPDLLGRRFAWCDQENPGAWDYSSVTSQAGFLDIEPASPIIAAISTRTGTLFWTGKKSYRSRFLGMPYIYNSEELADSTTPWSPQSMVTTSSMVVWMSQQGLFSYDGTSILPITCKIRPWIDDDIDPIYVRQEACAVHVATFNEFWWFFPQLGQKSNTRAMIYNYRDGWFSQAQMPRTAGVTAAYNSHTIMANGTVAYQHEYGTPGQPDSYANDTPLPWAETFELNLTKGSRLITIKQMIPDIEISDITDPGLVQDALNNLRYSLFYRISRSIGDIEQQTKPSPVRSGGYVDFRTTGRDIRMRFDVAGPGVAAFTLGQHLIDSVVRGDR